MKKILNKKDLRERNKVFLKSINIKNKTHEKILLKSKEDKVLRLVVFFYALFSILTTTSKYILASALILICIEIYVFSFDKILLKRYKLKRIKGILNKKS